MHDPSTVAFEVHWPWNTVRQWNDRRAEDRYHEMPRYKRPDAKPKYRYFTPAITIWHEDPELRGSDDSCGWFTPPMKKRQRERIEGCAWNEAYTPLYQRTNGKTVDDLVLAETLMRGAFVFVANALDITLTAQELLTWPAALAMTPGDNGLSSLAFLAGWHTNGTASDQKARQEHANALMYMVARYILREHRPWYRHPRWHVHHWRLQVHVVQAFKRWAFSRCCKCSKGFAWGASVCTASWSGTGPRWFRSEPNVYHCECDGQSVQPTREEVHL